MNAPRVFGVLVVVTLAGLTWLVNAGPMQPALGVQGRDARLEALRPDRPMAYLELGEEIADAATTDAERDLARRLFALAGVLDSKRLGRSAALALADLAENPREKRRLLALASLLTPPGHGQMLNGDGPGGEAVIGPGTPAGSSAVVALVEAFSHYRKGEGAQALTQLRKPGAMELLERYSRHLPGGDKRFLEDCKHYREKVRPFLTAAELTGMLRLEAALLAGSQRSWSGELLLNDGRPLIEVDPQRLEDALEVDGSRPYYRGGRWVGQP
ncbi:MAG: hypothetical protein JSV91_01975 [Phycisphaerales bacterium]|nr:MAG: hypothetical protein JSV91_01975 [Phycisphaerales bacterium]